MTSARALADPGAASDADLVAMMSTGSANALQALHDRYSARALRVARSVCNDQGDAEDAVQEAFVSVFTTSTTYSSSAVRALPPGDGAGRGRSALIVFASARALSIDNGLDDPWNCS